MSEKAPSTTSYTKYHRKCYLKHREHYNARMRDYMREIYYPSHREERIQHMRDYRARIKRERAKIGIGAPSVKA